MHFFIDKNEQDPPTGLLEDIFVTQPIAYKIK